MTTTATINSDDINSVSFPGSEAGLSIIEMVGTVSVSGSISSITLRLTAHAETPAAAVPGAANSVRRIRIAATSTGRCTSAVVAQSKIKFFADPQQATAQVSSGVRCLRITSASTQGVVTLSAVAKTLVFRQAITDAVSVWSVKSFQKTTLGATSVASAIAAPAYPIRKLPVSAETTAAALFAVPAKLNRRLSALQIAQASSSVNELTVSFVSAITSALANPSGIFVIVRQKVYPSHSFPEAVSTVSPILIGKTSAASNPAATFNVAAIAKYRLSAIVNATVSYAIAEADYSTTMPAPIERVMFVPAINRRIEVTE